MGSTPRGEKMTIEEQKKTALLKINTLFKSVDDYKKKYGKKVDSIEGEVLLILNDIKLCTQKFKCTRHGRIVIDNLPDEAVIRAGVNILCPLCQKEARVANAMLNDALEGSMSALIFFESLI